ncbi:MAG: hypothetical protein ACKVP4_08210 [Hyphomicrobium sp.]
MAVTTAMMAANVTTIAAMIDLVDKRARRAKESDDEVGMAIIVAVPSKILQTPG